MTTTLTRRGRLCRRLDVAPPCPCPRCGRPVVVVDHRTPLLHATASRQWRYEVTCDACGYSDADGYPTRRAVVDACNASRQEASKRPPPARTGARARGLSAQGGQNDARMEGQAVR